MHSDHVVPAIEFLSRCPVGARIEAIVEAVRAFPPPSFPPSQMWHVMSGEMKGLYEIRVRNRQTSIASFAYLMRTVRSMASVGRHLSWFQEEPNQSAAQCRPTFMPMPSSIATDIGRQRPSLSSDREETRASGFMT
jgi:hypothetical protein